MTNEEHTPTVTFPTSIPKSCRTSADFSNSYKKREMVGETENRGEQREILISLIGGLKGHSGDLVLHLYNISEIARYILKKESDGMDGRDGKYSHVYDVQELTSQDKSKCSTFTI